MSDGLARFVVGTGRCGSTLLSRMLAQNRDVLSVFELFSGIDQFFRFRTDPVDGAELAGRLRQDHPMLTMVLRRGAVVPEVVYPFDDPATRHAPGDPVPWALAIAIPRISDDPDALFDELLAQVETLPRQPLSAHYRRIFDWLTQRCDKRWWIERSGTSIDFLGELDAFFPDARFLHIHRDGREAALSMRDYPVLRVAVAVMYGTLGEVEYSHEGLTELERRHPEQIDRLLETRSPVELYGRYWSEQIARGHAALQKLAPERYMEIRFEDLVTRPDEVLRGVADFLEIGTADDWIDRAAALARGLPPTRRDALPPDERARLEASTSEAMRLLGREPGPDAS